MTEPSDAEQRPGPGARRRRRWPWVLLGGVLVLWLIAAVGSLGLAALQARDGLDAMQDVRSIATGDLTSFVDSVGGATDDVAEEDAPARLRSAADSFGAANGLVDSPVVKPLQFLPMIGRQLRSVSSLSASAETTATEAADAFEELTGILEGPSEDPGRRLAAAQQTETILTDLEAGIADPDLGPGEALFPPLADARNRFADEHAQVMNTLGIATAAVTGVNDFLEGPTRYLVLASNNAEMRAGGGMYLQVGVMDVQAGRFEPGEFTPAGDLYLETPGAELAPDVASTWGWLQPNQEWRNLNLTPRFDESARMAAEMWNASGRGPVDGVAAVDVLGLQKLLELTGPVDVGEVPGADTVSADTVVGDLMLEQYVDFVDDRDARRDRLGRVTTAAFRAFNDRPVSASKLLKVLQSAGEGRNVMLWSSVEVQQDAWVALGASGRVPDNSLLLSVQNRAGNKLDQFVKAGAQLSTRRELGVRRVSVRVTLANTAPGRLPQYVQGPHPRSEVGAGDYFGIFALTIPGGATNVSTTSAQPGFVRIDGDTKVATATVLLRRGETADVVVEFDLGQDWSVLEVLPSARIPPVAWTAGELSWKDTSSKLIDLDALG